MEKSMNRALLVVDMQNDFCKKDSNYIDFGELQVFADANTFPGIFIYRNQNKKSKSYFTQIDSPKSI